MTDAIISTVEGRLTPTADNAQKAVASAYPYRRFGLEDLRDMPVREVNASYWCAWNGQALFDWWHRDDFLLVEEIVNACRRNSREPLEEVSESVVSLLGEAELEDASKIAAFRATLPRVHDL